MYVCICNPVTDAQVRACAQRGAATLSDLQAELGVALQCGLCAPVALAIAQEALRSERRAGSSRRCLEDPLAGAL